MITIILTAISLSFDSFATAISASLKKQKDFLKTSFQLAFVFSVFQAGLFFLGYLFGGSLKTIISSFDHWFAFVLLFGVGIKFIFEAFDNDEEKIKKINLKVLAILGIATSVDALVVGVSFAFVNINLLVSVFVIALITFFISLSGCFYGRKLHLKNSKRIEIVGGLILIVIGFKILFSHLFF